MQYNLVIMAQQIPLSFKVLIIGASRVGKTTAIQHFIDKKFVSIQHPTIGVDFSLKSISLIHDMTLSIPQSVILQLWDIAGEKKFRTIMPYYLTGTQGIILVCDCTNPLTLVQLDEFLELVKLYLDTAHIPMVLMSTKHDLPSMLGPADIDVFMYQHKIYEYFSNSAVTGLNIDTVFQHIGQLIAKKLVSA